MNRDDMINALLTRWAATGGPQTSGPNAVADERDRLQSLSDDELQAELQTEAQPNTYEPIPNPLPEMAAGARGAVRSALGAIPNPTTQRVSLDSGPGGYGAGAPGALAQGVAGAMAGSVPNPLTTSVSLDSPYGGFGLNGPLPPRNTSGGNAVGGSFSPSTVMPFGQGPPSPAPQGSLFGQGGYGLADQSLAGLLGRGFNPGGTAGDVFGSLGQARDVATAQGARNAQQGPAAGGAFFPVQGYGGGKLSRHWGSGAEGAEGGTDIMAAKGTPVLAMKDGVVTMAGTSSVGGNYLQFKDNDGIDYYYAHMDGPTGLKPGDRLTAGQQVGAVGNTGNAFKGGAGEPHLHIGIGNGIQEGTGDLGGLGGGGYDAVTVLNQLLEQGNQPGAGGGGGGEAGPMGPGMDIVRTGRAFNPAKDMPQSFQEAAGFVGDVGRNYGLSEDGVKALVTILAGEGNGWRGISGDSGQSHGAFQFYTGGKLHAFAADNGLSDAAAAQRLKQAPMAGVDWAVRSYLGPAIQAAEQEGGDVPAMVRRALVGVNPGEGQNSKADPNAYLGFYNQLFGGGQQAPSLEGTATSAGIAYGNLAGLKIPPPRVPPGGFTNAREAADFQQSAMDWGLEAIDALGPNPTEQQISAVMNITAGLSNGAYQWTKLAQDQGNDVANRELQKRSLQNTETKTANDYDLGIKGLNLQERGLADANTRALLQLNQEGELATGFYKGTPTLANTIGMANIAQKEAELYGMGPGGQKTVGAQTLEEEIANNRRKLQAGFSDLLTTQGTGMQTAQQAANTLAQRQAENAAMLDPSGQYLEGNEPGGFVSGLHNMIGMPFAPITAAQLPRGPNPQTGMAELAAAFERAKSAYPQY